MLDEALEYFARGWSVIPIKPNSKLPAIKWQRFQSELPTEAEIRKWFAKPRNIAIVCGAVSGDLVVRDFDVLDVYRRWEAANPILARTLPTVETVKGRHVYFTATRDELLAVGFDAKITHVEGGELRAGGGYCLLPPSVHPDGPKYRWLNPPGDTLPRINLAKCGFINLTCNGEQPRERRIQRITEDNRSNVDSSRERDPSKVSLSSACNGSLNGGVSGGVAALVQRVANRCSADPSQFDRQIEHAIEISLPTRPGKRNRQVFELARALKAISILFDASFEDCRPYVVEWHKRALPYIRTEPFEETWIDFIRAWPRVKFPAGSEPMGEIVKRAKQGTKSMVEQRYESEGVRLLIRLCRELQQEAGNRPFYLSCRTVARLLNVTVTTAWRWLFLLQTDKVIQVIELGSQKGMKATRFRYQGD